MNTQARFPNTTMLAVWAEAFSLCANVPSQGLHPISRERALVFDGVLHQLPLPSHFR